ncbi:hypothetical protein [Paraburkholderia fungorum]|uniref:hypothetical protein n=1 Tax=Paraburkholderia fungorum TaxID=134537 RepID=UPI0011C348FB|nr:hypothetical protein [Paraburkholderia fungorum]
MTQQPHHFDQRTSAQADDPPAAFPRRKSASLFKEPLVLDMPEVGSGSKTARQEINTREPWQSPSRKGLSGACGNAAHRRLVVQRVGTVRFSVATNIDLLDH